MTFTKRSFVALTMILGCVLGFSSTSFGADSTFDSDNEGWVSFQNGGAVVVHVATGGNPGGFISSVDISDDWGYVLAPITFNAPALYGGELTFDLRAFTSEPVSWPIIFDVRVGLVGDGLTLINESTTPTGQWTGFSFALDENSGWRKFSSLDQNYTAHPRCRGRQRGADNSATPASESPTASNTFHREDAKDAKRVMPSIVLSWRSSRLGGSISSLVEAIALCQRQAQRRRQEQPRHSVVSWERRPRRPWPSPAEPGVP
jgi:hypothetical protein